jgi:hypothetical protein
VSPFNTASGRLVSLFAVESEELQVRETVERGRRQVGEQVVAQKELLAGVHVAEDACPQPRDALEREPQRAILREAGSRAV